MKAVWADERITAAVSDMDNLDKVRENIGRRPRQDQAHPGRDRGAVPLRRRHPLGDLRRLRPPVRRRRSTRRCRSAPPCATSCTTTSTASPSWPRSCSASCPPRPRQIADVDFTAARGRLPPRRGHRPLDAPGRRGPGLATGGVRAGRAGISRIRCGGCGRGRRSIGCCRWGGVRRSRWPPAARGAARPGLAGTDDVGGARHRQLPVAGKARRGACGERP